LLGRLIVDKGVPSLHLQQFNAHLSHFRPEIRDIANDLETKRLTELSAATAVVLNLRFRDGTPTTTAITLLRQMAPHVGIYVVGSSTDARTWLTRLAWAGADEVASSDDLKDLADLLVGRLHAPPPEEVLRLLWKGTGASNERAVVMHFVRNGFSPRQLDPWRATWFGRSLKTIRARLRDADMPPPGLLARFGCVIHACELARFLKMDEAARRVGVASAKELYAKRKSVRRSLGRWPLVRTLLV
jgi:hypothetical protein